MSYTDQLTKYGAKLDRIDAQIKTLTDQREEIISNLQNLGSTNAKTTTTGRKAAGSMGDRIVKYLQSTPGKNLEEVANSLKVAPQRVGLSIYHLINKGRVREDNKQYFATASAKTTDNTEE